MLKYNCIIVEDEPIAAEILKDYIGQIPFLELKGVCSDALLAMQLMQTFKIDLIFLDIHLPRLNGVEFIKTLAKPPGIIITTAHQEYTLDGYLLNVLDYMLKPIEFSRFLISVSKLKPLNSKEVIPNLTATTFERNSLFFNVGKKKVRVHLDEILYIESLKEYIRITTREKNILTKFQLGDIQHLLLNNSFLRIHRSFIVAQDKIETLSATEVEINGKKIPIGRSYKELVLSQIENMIS